MGTLAVVCVCWGGGGGSPLAPLVAAPLDQRNLNTPQTIFNSILPHS
jgi:hypothetical protein